MGRRGRFQRRPRLARLRRIQLATSFRMIQHGEADVMIAGGSEAAVTGLTIGGFAAMRALSTRNDDPQGASRPFDKDRDGFVLGEGAGHAGAGRAGIRQGSRCEDSGRNHRLRHERGRLSHDRNCSRGRRRATQHACGAAGCRNCSRGGRLCECSCDFDACWRWQ